MTDNLRAILLMTFAMAGFALEDMFIKLASDAVPTGQIMALLGLTGILAFGAMARARGVSLWSRDALHPAVIGRNLAEIAGTAGFITAIITSPLIVATAIFQAMPLAITCGAALFLGERVGWRRWTAILLGFVGVMIVIRPGMEGFRVESLWAVLAVAGLSARDLFTRKVPRRIASVQLAGWGTAAVAILGLAIVAVTRDVVVPQGWPLAWLAAAMVAGFAGYWALTESTRLGDLSAVMPFRYARLVFALFIGALVFGERPDLWTLVGAALIVATGIYTFARERRLSRLSTTGGAG